MPQGKTSSVPASKSKDQITKLLLKHGATQIGWYEEYDTDACRVTAICLGFTIPVKEMTLPFRMKVPLKAGPRQTQYEQAVRVAYRNIYWWLETNLGFVDLGFIDLERVLLAWIEMPMQAGGGTVGDHVLGMLREKRLPVCNALLARNEEVVDG